MFVIMVILVMIMTKNKTWEEGGGGVENITTSL